MHADGLTTYGEPGSWTFLAVRGVWQDNLADFDARYELTTYPTDLLWGPGNQDDATEWLASAAPQSAATERACTSSPTRVPLAEHWGLLTRVDRPSADQHPATHEAA
jgi:hypothetical protein